MRNITKYITALVVMVLGATSCSKEYLETAPTNETAVATVFTTTTNAFAALNGMHRYMYSQWFGQQDQGGQSGNMLYMDVMGEDLVMTAQSNGWLISTYKWQTHRNANSSVSSYNYLFYYAMIGNANLILANIDNVEGPEAEKKLIKGQALAYRGWAYFQMIQLFGKRFDKANANAYPGVPIVLTPQTTATPRSTVAEVYTQINKDLDEAIVQLAGYTRSNKSHININVAKGFKARVALAQQEWATAATMAAEARQGVTLMTNAQYMAGFNDYTNPEWLWGSRQQADQTTFFYSFFAYMSANFGSTNIRGNPKAINSKLYSMIRSTDVRKQLWDSTGTNTAFPIPLSPAGIRKPYMNRKFLSGGGEASSIGDVPLMRAAEMYLIEAEAKARMGGQDAAAAATLYTLARLRDPSYVMSTNTGVALINEIMTQRRIELWGEGFRFYDLKRTNGPLDRTGANHDGGLTGGLFNVPAGDIQWEFLIPQAEINNTNGVVIQNPL
ncbi:RagB/SusD family nutrient uptake outer membrane protein [Flavitalea sp.]|nr:RagB/SusD family nutrient uptake outer membrane protein [Flavitalea sp.]